MRGAWVRQLADAGEGLGPRLPPPSCWKRCLGPALSKKSEQTFYFIFLGNEISLHTIQTEPGSGKLYMYRTNIWPFLQFGSGHTNLISICIHWIRIPQLVSAYGSAYKYIPGSANRYIPVPVGLFRNRIHWIWIQNLCFITIRIRTH
jgi:hypothetical protein